MNKLPFGFTPLHTLSGLSPDTPVLVAFSGGADSHAMLKIICEYSKMHGTPVFAAHLNHMIRGEEADRDEQFCRGVCECLGVHLFVRRTDVPAMAKQSGESIETAARRARYEFFDGLMAKNNIPLLATAHNANDNLETVLFNITRGCALGGVCGIPETRKCQNGLVVRPILGMSRAQILDYCTQASLDYVTDSTNTDTDYTRNKIRATVIPSLLEINPAAVENASRMSKMLREDALCLESLSDWFCEEMNEDASFELEKLAGSPDAVTSRAVISLYSSLTGGKALEYVHLKAIRDLCHAAIPHSSVDLPHGICATIENKALHLCKKSEIPKPCKDFCIELCEGKNFISEINAEIIMRNSQSAKNIYKTSIPMYLDFDTINSTLTARNRQPSDKIKIRGVNKSVKKLLCDMHIPLDVRYRLPVICCGNEIAAIPLVGVADGYRQKNGHASVELEAVLL